MFKRIALLSFLALFTGACMGGSLFLVVDHLSVEHDGISGTGDYDDAVIIAAGMAVTIALDIDGMVLIPRDDLELRLDEDSPLADRVQLKNWELHWTPTEDDLGPHEITIELWDAVKETRLDTITLHIDVVILEQYQQSLVEFGFIMQRDEDDD